ncbi:MAG TPA: hypothetical protein VGY77_12600 [Gemmataceae bacterium]|jgi:hypothetical protein|nr:hypothetical protein [Gemmataceae bacterium]
MDKLSVHDRSREEAFRYKWIESEKAGRDLGDEALRQWVKKHWNGYLRSAWMEHIEGTRWYLEFNAGDFGLLKRVFENRNDLLNHILDRLKKGQENLDIILWAQDSHIPFHAILVILQALDINSCRLSPQFVPLN